MSELKKLIYNLEDILKKDDRFKKNGDNKYKKNIKKMYINSISNKPNLNNLSYLNSYQPPPIVIQQPSECPIVEEKTCPKVEEKECPKVEDIEFLKKINSSFDNFSVILDEIKE
jgi:hypothetical protein